MHVDRVYDIDQATDGNVMGYDSTVTCLYDV